MSNLLFICPSHRDHRELERLGAYRQHRILFHDYASIQLEEIACGEDSRLDVPDVHAELERILCAFGDADLDGVISTDDYPGSALASIVAQNLGLPGVSPKSNLMCQHKFHSRVAQKGACPEVVPRFMLLNGHALSSMPLPCFVKPVKSFFSVGAYRVDDPARASELVERATLPERFFDPFRSLFLAYAGMEFGEGRVLIEELLEGHQATIEGYAWEGQIQILGIVDSIMFPGTVSFSRFEYPSGLSASVQGRIADMARTVMPALGFGHGFFNIEVMYNAERDAVHIIEINPRMASQFADLYEKVDGLNTYSTLLELALGRRPQARSRQGKYPVAVSYVLRRFRDARVLKVPSREQLDAIQAWQPDIRVEILATEGKMLSQEMQDGHSYRYGIINAGANDRHAAMQLFAECSDGLAFSFSDC